MILRDKSLNTNKASLDRRKEEYIKKEALFQQLEAELA